MRIAIISILAAFAATALGIEIKTPAMDQKVAQDNSIVVRWSSVSTDPATMDIYLVNLAIYPNTQNLIATGVDTSLGEYTIKGKDVNVDPGKGYQVNFVSTINAGILAQSQQFNILPKASEASTSASTMTDTMTSSAHTKTISSTSAISTTTNAAGMLSPPQVGSLFLGFMALAL